MNNLAKRRALILTAFLAAIFTIYSAKLIVLQVSGHEAFLRTDAHKYIRKDPLFARRGTITDVNGEVLAQNEPTRRIIADASLIDNPEAVVALLTKPLGMSSEQLHKKLRSRVFSQAAGREIPDQYIILKNDVPVDVAEAVEKAVEEAKIKGVFSKPDSIRRYPNGSLLCHVTGFTNGENIGLDGIELTMNDWLSGNDGYRFVERAASGRELVLYRGEERAPRDGHNIKLTVDMGLQNIVETEIDTAMKQFRPKSAVILMMRPQTGEILAVANRPNFDLNHYKDASESQRRNRAITDSFEPGSTFKIVTLAGALTERIVRPETPIFCENGYYSRFKLRDSHPMGTLSVSDILVKSSNIGACKLAVQMGEQKFYEYVRKFGFGELTNVTLPGEENGILDPPHRWTKLTISRIPMGHEINATALQIVNAMSAIANGGELMIPQIVREITNAEGKVVRSMTRQPVRRIASPEAVRALNEAMKLVASPKGTAALAHVSGFKVAGKTGTAQVFEKGKGYSHSRYRSSFCGYLPADAPEFTCLVFLDEPHMANQKAMGGLVCAPVFSRVAERAAGYLGLVPEPEPIPFQLAK